MENHYTKSVLLDYQQHNPSSSNTEQNPEAGRVIFGLFLLFVHKLSAPKILTAHETPILCLILLICGS